MRDLQGFTANSESKPSSASVTVHRVFFIFSPNITCPPHALPQHVHLSQLTSLPISPSPQKWQETAARHQKLLGAFLYGVLTNAVQLRNVRQTITCVLLAKHPSLYVLSRACFSRTSFLLCLFLRNLPSRVCLSLLPVSTKVPSCVFPSKTPSNTNDFPKNP